MNPTILRTNATAVYRFLSLIQSELAEGESLCGKRILDCGAGGPIPPLAIFVEQGMIAAGIDISEPQLERSRAFIERTGLAIDLQRADMRDLPFPNASFDYVYEHYSICHLNVSDTTKALAEMRRVLVPGGMGFLGVISNESWPLSEYGEERSPGEFWMVNHGHEARHSLFSDEASDALVADWELLAKEKAVLYVGGDSVSPEEWSALHAEAPTRCSLEEWNAFYRQRGRFFRYVHTYYTVRKPTD